MKETNQTKTKTKDTTQNETLAKEHLSSIAKKGNTRQDKPRFETPFLSEEITTQTDLYLRDLNPPLQKEFIAGFKKNDRQDLLKALEEDKDIILGGMFSNDNSIKVVA